MKDAIQIRNRSMVSRSAEAFDPFGCGWFCSGPRRKVNERQIITTNE